MPRFRRPAVLAGLCFSVLSLFVLTRRSEHGVSSHGFGAASERAQRLLRGEGWGDQLATTASGEGEGSLFSSSPLFRRRASTPRAPPGRPYFTDDEDAMLEAAAAAGRDEQQEHGGGGSSGGHHGHYWHKPLHPIDGWDLTGVGLACIGLMIAAAGGIGGGGILVPLYILVLGFDPKHAIPLSNITIFGGAITNTVLNLSKRHPDADRPLVDWDLILVMEPLTSELPFPPSLPRQAPLAPRCVRAYRRLLYPRDWVRCQKPKVTPHLSVMRGACVRIMIANRSF